MVRFRRIRLADHRGRDATVLLVPVGESVKRRKRTTTPTFPNCGLYVMM